MPVLELINSLRNVSERASEIAKRIWLETSRNWIYLKGLIMRIVNTVIRYGKLPVHALCSPMSYANEDRYFLSKLKKLYS